MLFAVFFYSSFVPALSWLINMPFPRRRKFYFTHRTSPSSQFLPLFRCLLYLSIHLNVIILANNVIAVKGLE